ncbi:hypothetical protein [Bradyrhizobium quebecense]|uniref:Uncharacterized protein n=2 Tax=Bradyrhizobium quebecense TaxID=2748629 RepID=A0ABS3MSU0_9BRAD|nr:hypothetical protein [Bradyrhizobium quebecense]UGY02374.1 hypothetical protein J4P68_0035660 [Bradyrhizobium quebecense]
MIKVLKAAAHIVWAVSIISLGTLIGASFGWVHHGWIGAIAVGTIGFSVGALLAADPLLVLHFLHGGL